MRGRWRAWQGQGTVLGGTHRVGLDPLHKLRCLWGEIGTYMSVVAGWGLSPGRTFPSKGSATDWCQPFVSCMNSGPPSQSLIFQKKQKLRFLRKKKKKSLDSGMLEMMFQEYCMAPVNHILGSRLKTICWLSLKWEEHIYYACNTEILRVSGDVTGSSE